LGGYFYLKKPDAGQVLQRVNLGVRFMQVLIVRSDVFIAKDNKHFQSLFIEAFLCF
jgi:hypothetical protein